MGDLKEIVAGLRAEGAGYLHRLAEPVPIVRGREVLFVYHDPAASSVGLVHHVMGIPRAPRFERVGDGLFLLHMVLPDPARLEYTFRRRNGTGRDEIVLDPGNPRTAACPFGLKSVAETASYETPDCVPFRDGIERGVVEEHRIDSVAFGEARAVSLYVPARPPEFALLVHDGGDYRHFSDLIQTLDNLIAEDRMAPVVAALTHPVWRNLEYSCTAPHADFMARDVLPWIRRRFDVRAAGLMGSSFGAVASVYTAYRHGNLLDRLLLQSGSFIHQATAAPSIIEPVDEFDRIRLFLESEFFPNGFARRMRIYQSCGTFEPVLYNRSFAERMREAGHPILYRESHDGHNWVSWRDHFGAALPYLFPGR